MTESVWIADLTADQLTTWLKAPRTEAPFAILERIDAIDFPAREEEITPEQWTRGRIFGPGFELRWERQGEIYHARLTGTRGAEAPFAVWPELADTEMSDTSCYMWGRDEMRIGRRLDYRAVPKGEGRLRLSRREFRRRTDSALVSDRLTRMAWEVQR